jgi:ABC-type glycerol-3-phosphate transport system permease component
LPLRWNLCSSSTWRLTSSIAAAPSRRSCAVDGCTPLEAFLRVVLPLAVPGLIAAGILAFIFSWNEFPFVLSLTIPAVLLMFLGQRFIVRG